MLEVNDPAYVHIDGLSGKTPAFKVITQPKPAPNQRFLPDGKPNPTYRP